MSNTTPTKKFEYKYPPLPHQREVLRISHNQRGFALFMDPGTGKTYVVINSVAYWYEQGLVDGLLVVAPNNVHVNWVTDEIPKHMPDRVPWSGVIWRSGRMTRRVNKKLKYKQELEDLLTFKGVAVLAMNYEAILSKIGRDYALRFLAARKTCLAQDEADEYMAEPGSKRFKRMVAFGRRAVTLRPMTGTPVEEKPEHAYGIMKGVDENYWLPIPDYKAFRNKICEYEERTNATTGNTFRVVTRYKNLDWLSDQLYRKAFRYRKDNLNLPPKRYTKYFVELSSEQERMYKELAEQYRTSFLSGEPVTAALTLTRYLRLQQIVCGYVPPDDQLLVLTDEMLEDDEALEQAVDDQRALKQIDAINYRLKALVDCIERYPVKTMIWARFSPDIDQIMDVLGDSAVRYDGKVSDTQRVVNKNRYLNDPTCHYFVGHQKAGGRGLTLINTEHVVYYSNMWSARARTQSEDRAHRIGLQHSVLYTDLCALGTIDTYIVARLRSKKNIAREVMRDPYTPWI